jgi:signal transduction histidine kinase
MDRELHRLKGLLDDFVDAARPPDVHPMACDLTPTVRQSLDVFQEECAAGGVRVEVDLPGPLAARADAERIGQVLRNLVRNSLEAMQENAGPKVLRVRGGARNGRVTIEVSDNGPGIPGEVLPRIFEPWFSTKKNGLGLGLALSRAFVESHGGSLEAVSGSERGTTFRISLPGGGAA